MKRLIAAIASAAMCVSFTGSSASAAPPPIVNAPTTTFTSSNVHPVINIPTGEAVGGKFAMINGKEYFFQTTVKSPFYNYDSPPSDGGVWAFDVTNPEQPIPVGHLPLPVSQNEDVDLSASRGLLFYVADNAPVNSDACSLGGSAPAIVEGNVNGNGLPVNVQVPNHATFKSVGCARKQGILFTIDISNPMAMRPLSVLLLPEGPTRTDGRPMRGAGHTATCVLDCNYVLVSARADRGMEVVDLTNPKNPQVMGDWATPAGADNWNYKPGTTHNAHVDQFGNLWSVGSGGTAMYAPVSDPMNPKLLAATPAALTDAKTGPTSAPDNQLIHHGVQRLDKNTVVIAEEWFPAPAHTNTVQDTVNSTPAPIGLGGDCGTPNGQKGEHQGRLQTWGIDLKHKVLKLQGMWDTELATNTLAYDNSQLLGIGCSSHWFTINDHKILADGWYEQGVRFLDVSNPRNIRQVGYMLEPYAAASQAVFVPGRNDLVYVSDYQRGLDVVKIDNAGASAPTVVAPVRAEWFANYRGVQFHPHLKPDSEFGWACLRPALEL